GGPESTPWPPGSPGSADTYWKYTPRFLLLPWVSSSVSSRPVGRPCSCWIEGLVGRPGGAYDSLLGSCRAVVSRAEGRVGQAWPGGGVQRTSRATSKKPHQ